MPAKKPRVNVPRDALETHEDLVLAEIAVERERTVDRKTLTHDAVWRRGPKSKRR
jgi:hypothetical protein